MKIEEKHEMRLESKQPTGAEEWYCPTCGRRVMMQWSPTFNMVILEAGNLKASHIAIAGALRLEGHETTGPNESEPEQRGNPKEEQDLNIWKEGLQDIDMDNLG